MKSIVVSDSSALIVLSKINAFYLLENLFEKIHIAKSVLDEASQKEGVKLLINLFDVKTPKCHPIKSINLDRGELDSIFLAVELKLPLLIDEKKGRKVAMTNGVEIFGTLGVVLKNYQNGQISKDDAISIFGQLQENGFRVSSALRDEFFGLLVVF